MSGRKKGAQPGLLPPDAHRWSRHDLDAITAAERANNDALLRPEDPILADRDSSAGRSRVLRATRPYKFGRTPGLTTIANDDEILAPLREMRADGRRVTQATLIGWTCTFTLAELRGYLRVTGQSWRDFLDRK
jgi:hypothetical protein